MLCLHIVHQLASVPVRDQVPKGIAVPQNTGERLLCSIHMQAYACRSAETRVKLYAHLLVEAHRCVGLACKLACLTRFLQHCKAYSGVKRCACSSAGESAYYIQSHALSTKPHALLKSLPLQDENEVCVSQHKNTTKACAYLALLNTGPQVA